MKDCNDIACKHNTANYPKLKRYGGKCTIHSDCVILSSHNVGMILRNSVSDNNYDVRRLNDDELKYCLAKETRKSGLAKLQAEARRRNRIDPAPKSHKKTP